MKGLSYILHNRLYLAVTNVSNSVSPIVLRGPSFRMPSESGFMPLPTGSLPTAGDIFAVVDEAFDSGVVAVGDMESDDITFAGEGEPLLQLHTLTAAASMIKERRHGAALRVKTNGLVAIDDCSVVAQMLANSGVSKISIALLSDNPKQYANIMQPKFPIRAAAGSVLDYNDVATTTASTATTTATAAAGFGNVCAMIIASAEAGLQVTCTAVERPEVNLRAVRSLAHSLGATDFATSSFHP